MHWLQGKMASEADVRESHARRAEQPLGLSRKVWRLGWEAPPKRSSLTTLFVFHTCAMEACYQKPERKKRRRKSRKTETHREKETGRRGWRGGDQRRDSEGREWQMTSSKTTLHQKGKKKNHRRKCFPLQITHDITTTEAEAHEGKDLGRRKTTFLRWVLHIPVG